LEKIIVNSTRSDKVGEQLKSIKDYLNQVNGIIKEGEKVECDFINYKYSPPLLSGFFSAFNENETDCNYINTKVQAYANSIHFHEGLRPDKIDNWQEKLDTYQNKSYLPLINFSTSKKQIHSILRDNLFTHVNKLIRTISNLPTNYFSAIAYLLSELTDNIVEHSNTERGWISFQYYKQKGFLDLCIADSGVGLLESYKKYQGEKDFSHITTHVQAVDNAIKGNSTKHLNERGFGIHTSREMLVSGLGGTFVMFSGNAILINYKLIDFKCNYEGTLAMMRIPCENIDNSFNLYSYIE
jgi:anti-sigma regulatory factor (Ser/Thr protein kinase)